MSSTIMYPGEAGFLRMRRLYLRIKEEFGLPYKVIHVAGTSGKGSTSIMSAKILESLGLKVGIFVTPYLYNSRETIQINGVPIKQRAHLRVRNMVEEIVCDIDVPEIGGCTFFEKLTARALLHFGLEKVDVAVIETAMGGQYDATNVVESDVSVIVPVSIDHARLLGKDRASIAVHKAGIIKESNKKVVVGRQFDDVKSIIENAAKKLKVHTSYLGRDFEVDTIDISEKGTTFSYRGYAGEGNIRLEDVNIALIGAHQADNAAVAITAARELLGPAYPIEKFSKGVKKALKKVKNPGRFSILRHNDKTIILDVAHNPEKIASVVRTFQTLFPHEKAAILFSCKWTKDAAAMARTLKDIAEIVYLTQFFNQNNPEVNRVMDKQQLVEAFRDLGVDTVWCDDAKMAMTKAMAFNTKFLLITGSFHLLREIDLRYGD